MGLSQKAAAFIMVRSNITRYCQTNTNPLGGFQGIVLENSNAASAEQLTVMVGALGLTIVLPSARLLILLPTSLDRELIAHRLSLSLNTKALICFEADTPEKALELIQPYL
jgi:hypothetical protein